jgi:hypothetical protein
VESQLPKAYKLSINPIYVHTIEREIRAVEKKNIFFAISPRANNSALIENKIKKTPKKIIHVV